MNYLLASIFVFAFLATTTVIIDGLVFSKNPENIAAYKIYLSLAILHGFVLAFTTTLLVLTYLKCKSCCQTALKFHDFLIDYKATPRSKLLRKHVPDLDAVVEEPSFYE